MTDMVFVANVNQTWDDVARKMLHKSLHHIVIVDENHTPVGMASVSDLLAHYVNNQARNLHRTLGESFEQAGHAPKLYTVDKDSRLFDAAHLMDIHHVQCLPVIDERRRLLGVITPTDIMRSMLEASA